MAKGNSNWAFLPFLFFLLSLPLADLATTSVRTRGLVQPSSPSSLQNMNRYFRHSSFNFVGNATSKLWNLLPSIDWRSAKGKNIVGSPMDQGTCRSCWAISAVGSLEAAYAQAYNVTKPDISVQEILDCNGRGISSNCVGGLPIQAFDFIVKTTKSGIRGLLNAKSYPYKGLASKVPICWKRGVYGISMYETTDFFGWFGLLLTLQSQPVVVLLQADEPTFVNFQGSGIYDNPECYSNTVNHAVVLVGYNLSNSVPYWIIKNSWGSSWGDNGFAKIAIRGGEGVCGIQANPGVYPVVAGNPPCSGNINPCGGGTCKPNSTKTGSYTCSCPSGFIAVKSIDKTETCTPIDACGFGLYNPCNFGTCVNDLAGGYSCICPYGYTEGIRCDNSKTCVPVEYPNSNSIVKFNKASCAQILSQFRLTPAKFRTLNGGRDCNSVKSGSTINVTTSSTCSIYYSSRKNYSCSLVMKLFKLTPTQFSFLNPSINCLLPISSFIQVCVKSGIPANYTVGNQTYAINSGDTCQNIIERFNLTANQFFTLNPGIYCDGLIPVAGFKTPGQLVYISGIVGSTICKYTTYVVKKGDTCARLIYSYFQNKISVFKKYNNNAACTSTWLYVGRKICRP